MKHLKTFRQLNETNGYGEEAYYFAKDGDQYNYLFKIEDANNEGHRGFIISIGKFSKFTQPSEAQSDYGVLGITEVSEAELDQAVTDKGVFEPNDKRIEIDQPTLRKVMVTLNQAIEDYLQQEPKVNKFYDEMQANIKDSDIYEENIKDAVNGWPGEWTYQEIEKGKLNLISK